MRPSISYRHSLAAFAAVLWVLIGGSVSAQEINAEALYKDHCASCHGAGRLGGQGPALLPQNLKRLRKKAALRVIAKGSVATQMPGFGETLSTKQIAALADYVYTPLDHIPPWGAEQISANHVVYRSDLVEGNAKSAKPIYDADPLNVFLVVETGDHHVTVLDGDKFEPIHRFKSRFALHGGPKYTSDGRFVYFASRDGWITKYDMYKLAVV
jgi:cytochrome c553